MAKNAATLAHDETVTHAINLERVSAGMRAPVIAHLEALGLELESRIRGTANIKQAQRLAELSKQAREVINAYYSKIARDQSRDLTELAGVEAVKAGNIINTAMGVGVEIIEPASLTAEQLELIVAKTPIMGHSAAQWWRLQSANLQTKFTGQMQQGLHLGEGVDKLARRVRGTKANDFGDGIMSITKRDAETLVRSSVISISNEAKMMSFEQHADLIKGIQWVATLDNRTTPICMALDGKIWSLDLKPIGHDKAFPGPVAHFNCRSTQVPVLRTWEELAGRKLPSMDDDTLQKAVDAKLKKAGMSAKQRKAAVVNSRASMDGQAARDQSFEEWLGQKPPDFQDDLLGPIRAELWRNDAITLSQLTDQNDRPLTVDQLFDMVAAGKMLPESVGVALPTAFPASLFLGSNDIVAELAGELVEKQMQEHEAAAQAVIDKALEGRTRLARAIRTVKAEQPDIGAVELLAMAKGVVLAQEQEAKRKAKQRKTNP